MKTHAKLGMIASVAIMLFAPGVVLANSVSFGDDGGKSFEEHKIAPMGRTDVPEGVYITRIEVDDGARVNNIQVTWSDGVIRQLAPYDHGVKKGDGMHLLGTFDGPDRLVRIDVFWDEEGKGGIDTIVFWHSDRNKGADVAGAGHKDPYKKPRDFAVEPKKSTQETGGIRNIRVLRFGAVINKIEIED